MNRQQRRAAGDTASRDTKMVAVEVRWGGTVRVGSARWGYIASEGAVFAFARMTIPNGMTRSETGDAHVQEGMDVEGPVVFEAPRSVWEEVSTELRGYELACGLASSVSVDGVSYDRALVARALEFVAPAHTITARQVTAGGLRCLRLESPDARALLAPCVPPEGAPGAALLDRAAMDAMDMPPVFDSPGDAVTARGGSA